ncbi:MAG: winged helix-turn-helix domain-containing protein [Promethearchaeota archaeon]
MAAVNYPPEGFYKNIKIGKKDFEHIILWMLANNEDCQWSNFKQEPLSFTESTLSKYLNMLISKGFVEKFARGQYRITSEGRKRYHEISSTLLHEEETTRIGFFGWYIIITFAGGHIFLNLH